MRSVLHIDMNACYASIECLYDPSIRNLPVAVGGDVEARHGIILAKNQIAKRYGVKTGEALWQAKQKCPKLHIVPPHFDRYLRFSRMAREIYADYTDLVEPFGLDEVWCDVTGTQKLRERGMEALANEIRERVKLELGITVSVGVSFNKIFAKMGSDYKIPDATTVITQENYKNILWPLDIRDLFFVGKATADKLQGIGIHTIGQLAESDRHTVTALLGKQGSIIHDYANGLDQTPVSRFDEREDVKSIGNGSTFRRNLEGIQDIRTAAIALSDTVAVRLRKKKKKAFGVKVDIKDPSLKVISRQQKLDNPTNLAENIADTAVSIIEKSWNLRRPIRMLTVTAINLCPEDQAQQLSLFSSENFQNETGEKMERTMDDIRKKFGRNAITFGRIIKNDIGLESIKSPEDSK